MTFLDQFFQSYLIAYIFVIQIALGCLIILMVHHIAGGKWGAIIQRILEAGAMTLPLLALLFIPIILGMHSLYEWTHTGVVARDAILQQKTPYLNAPFFIVRAIIYFVVWIGLAYFLRRWSLSLDKEVDENVAARFRKLSAPGMLLLGVTITFASVDWMMSLEPHWFSSIYGMKFGVGAFTSAMAFAIIVLLPKINDKPYKGIITQQNITNLGNFLLAAVMLWAYIAFSQYLIIWSGNLPEEIPWYESRAKTSWQWIALTLIFIHFFLPFFFLLARGTKRTPKLLHSIAMLVLGMRAVDIFWLIKPAFYKEGFHLSMTDITVILIMAIIWFAVFKRNLSGKPLLPLYDERLEESAHHGNREVASHAH